MVSYVCYIVDCNTRVKLYMILVCPESILSQDIIVWFQITKYLIGSISLVRHLLAKRFINTILKVLNMLFVVNQNSTPVVAVIKWSCLFFDIRKTLSIVTKEGPKHVTLIFERANHNIVKTSLTKRLNNDFTAS